MLLIIEVFFGERLQINIPSRGSDYFHLKIESMASVSDSIDFDAENIDASVTQSCSRNVRKGRKLRLKVWLHFERITNEDGNIVAICRYCQKHLVGNSSSGTKHLNNHVLRCLDAQGLKRSRGETEPTLGGGDLQNPSFDIERSREKFAKMVIVHQYPFSMIEHAFFRHFLKDAQPEIQLLSRNTVKSDCMKLYVKEKEKVMSSLDSLNCRVSLTSDMWTSIANDGYMCLTCHYIDDEWNLKKKILNFAYVEAPHGHKELAKVLLDKLLEWNIHKKFFSIVLDNASANIKAVKMLLSDPTFTQFLPLDGSWFHLRCSAHILNLIVQDGLKEIEEVIFKVRESVKYVKSSQQRKENFKKAARFEIGLKKSLILDVSTRWNSTYLMLERAAEFERVFSCLQLYDSSYPYALSVNEWKNIKLLIECLSIFYEVTERLSGTKFPTSNLFFGDICVIHVYLKQWCMHEESFISLMASRMLLKFDKYWKNTNTLLGIATILDPRYKMFMVRYFFERIYGDEAEEKVEEVKIGLQRLYDTYVIRRSDHSSENKTLNVSSIASVSKTRVGSSSRCTLSSIYMDFGQYIKQTNSFSSEKTDLDVCLEEPAKPEDDFDILKWWKSNSSKYPILSRMARDVLAIPVSTVASESTFSTGSRVLNKYRSSLDASTVQALICTENWLRDDVSSIDISKEDALSSIFASSQIIDEKEDEIEVPYDDSLAFSSASD